MEKVIFYCEEIRNEVKAGPKNKLIFRPNYPYQYLKLQTLLPKANKEFRSITNKWSITSFLKAKG